MRSCLLEEAATIKSAIRLRKRIFETVDAVGAANHAEILGGRESR
jgi:hypothetical protein